MRFFLASGAMVVAEQGVRSAPAPWRLHHQPESADSDNDNGLPASADHYAVLPLWVRRLLVLLTLHATAEFSGFYDVLTDHLGNKAMRWPPR